MTLHGLRGVKGSTGDEHVLGRLRGGGGYIRLKPGVEKQIQQKV
jgi:hypothetical protein